MISFRNNIGKELKNKRKNINNYLTIINKKKDTYYKNKTVANISLSNKTQGRKKYNSKHKL